VIIEGNRDLGAAAGAAVGGDLGSDNDKAPVAAGVIGALIGSAVGAEIGSKVNEKRAIELTIQLDNEKIISIVQEVSDKYSFFEGQRVKVVKSNYRSRVQPFNN
jgi:outer membrane lipoprotein SlyB